MKFEVIYLGGYKPKSYIADTDSGIRFSTSCFETASDTVTLEPGEEVAAIESYPFLGVVTVYVRKK